MDKQPIFIKQISQKNNHLFTIEWNDSVQSDYRLSHVQRNCPCAGCVDEKTGKRLLEENSISDAVKAIKIVSVGRYAIRIQFTSGCSMGIYDFELLRGL